MTMQVSAEELWGGVEFKLDEARFFLNEMSVDIRPLRDQPGSSQFAALMESTGALVGNMWQAKFYYHLDAFLVATRAVPDIIQMCFGQDGVTKSKKSPLNKWFYSLKNSEQKRRREFQQLFQPDYNNFRKLPLSLARNVTVHRRGVPQAEVQVIGRYGVYKGGPLAGIPSAESRPIIAGNDPALQWAATLPPQPVEPSANDFTFEIPQQNGPSQSIPLFTGCKKYLEDAVQLTTRARALYQQKHASQPLTPP